MCDQAGEKKRLEESVVAAEPAEVGVEAPVEASAVAAEPADVEVEPPAELPIEPVAQPAAPPLAPPPKPVGLRDRLTRTSEVLVGRLEAILGGRKVDSDLLDELEALLFTADLGVQTAESLLRAVRADAAGEDAARVREILREKILEKLRGSLFMAGFLDKGRMRSLLQAMPVRIILNDRTALYGPALFMANNAEKSET